MEWELFVETNQWILYFAVPIILFFLLFIYQARQGKKKTLEKIRTSFGKRGEKKYYHEEFENISHCFYFHQNGENEIDDITWNDLNMDEVYKNMDTTHSSLGQEVLYELLRKTAAGKEELLERDRLMKYFTGHEKERVSLSYIYSGFGFLKKLSVADYIEYLEECPKKSVFPHIGLMLLFIAALAYCLGVNAVTGCWLVIGVAAVNIVTYFRFKADIENYFLCIKQVFSMCACAKKVRSLKIPDIDEYNRELEELLGCFSGALRFSFIMSTGRGGIVEFFLDYVRMLTHLDIVKFYRTVDMLKSKKEQVWRMYFILGYLDAMTAAASYRACLPYWSEPELLDPGPLLYQAEGLYHPLIDTPVANSIHTGSSVLITGSNASGKSTFLRAAGINALLAQTLYTSTAARYKANRFRIYSSMALKDNLMGSESYYMVEIKSLKRIMDAAEIKEAFPVLCFIDEVLRGTNTIERIAASSQILKRLAVTRTLCFAATHDIELTNILERYFTNYHFSEEITEDDVKFNYKLAAGRATSRNAIKLLGLLGYKKELLDQAAGAAKHFEESGIWKQEI